MRRFRSIRLRLTAWYTLALVVIITLFAAATWLLAQAQLSASFDQALAARLQGAASTLDNQAQDGTTSAVRLTHNEDAVGGGAGEQVLLFMGGRLLDQIGAPLTTTQAAALLAIPADGQAHRLNLAGNMVRAMRVVQEGSLSLVAARPTAAVDQPLGNLLVAFTISAPLAVLLAALGGLFITSRALRPVAAITATARAIGAQDLSRRLALGPPRDELTALAATIDEMLARIEAGYERQRRFTADASHELRTPLAVVVAEAEVALMGRRSTAEYRAALNSITEEALQIQQLVADLLTLARSDAAQSMPRTLVDLHCLTARVMERCAANARAGGVTLALEDQSPAPRLTLANEGQLERALLNLVDNALKYGVASGWVSIQLTTTDHPPTGEINSGLPPDKGLFIALSVNDAGEGIEPQHLPHLFDRFYRADPARSRDERGGTGLGLAIAAAIAHAHGGWIGVRSVPSQGSRFTLYLPAANRS